MTKCVKYWSHVPYGGMWRFVHPETKVTITGRNRDHLMKSAKDHAKSNNLPIGVEFERRVEEWLCESMPDECVDCKDGKPMLAPRLGLGDVIAGTKVLLSFVAAGRPSVPKEEAVRRAKICWDCKYRVPFPQGCAGCSELAGLIAHAQDTGMDMYRQACGICRCSLHAAVWIPIEHQLLGVNAQMKLDFEEHQKTYPCWKHA